MPERATERLLVWRAGSAKCAARLDTLQEVVPAGGITPIPGAPAEVCGLANVRGRVVTVIDGRALAGASATAPPALLVLVRVRGRTVALAVDEVGDLVADGDGLTVLDLDALLAPFFPG
jgi:purine-binding chemotaxis protein CheW